MALQRPLEIRANFPTVLHKDTPLNHVFVVTAAQGQQALCFLGPEHARGFDIGLLDDEHGTGAARWVERGLAGPNGRTSLRRRRGGVVNER